MTINAVLAAAMVFSECSFEREEMYLLILLIVLCCIRLNLPVWLSNNHFFFQSITGTSRF